MSHGHGTLAEAARRAAEGVALTRQGLSATQIAAQLGVDPRTVVRWRHNAGMTSPDPRPEYSADVWVEAERMLDDGASFAEISRTLGMHRATLAKRFPGQSWSQEQCIRWAIEMRNIKKGMS